MNRTIPITFVTPCFCRGADCSDSGMPEIRPASIRGQLHWWFRALGNSPQDENAIFGSVHERVGNVTTPRASKVVIRVRVREPLATESIPTLPHKTGGPAAPKKAIAPGTTFDLLVSTRLGGLTPSLEQKFCRALDAWLHLGALGLRATRGGGNFSFEGQPGTAEAYASAIRAFCPPIRASLLPPSYTSAEAARKEITDTLASDAFDRVHFPLGVIRPSRKTSPLRFRIVKVEGTFRIIAVWDTRQAVTGNTDADLSEAIAILIRSNKKIGDALKDFMKTSSTRP